MAVAPVRSRGALKTVGDAVGIEDPLGLGQLAVTVSQGLSGQGQCDAANHRRLCPYARALSQRGDAEQVTATLRQIRGVVAVTPVTSKEPEHSIAPDRVRIEFGSKLLRAMNDVLGTKL